MCDDFVYLANLITVQYLQKVHFVSTLYRTTITENNFVYIKSIDLIKIKKYRYKKRIEEK